MKKFLSTAMGSLAICLMLILLQGCLKDSYTRTYHYTYYQPVYKTTAEVRANIKNGPAQPVEKPGKIYIKGSYIFLNDVDRGIHIIDNSNPSNPQRISFINIPGNMDLAVKGNILYADLYTDLVAIDISDPQNVVLKKVVENVFPHRYYNSGFVPDSTKVIARWEKRDTTVTEKNSFGGWLKSANVFMDYAAFNSGSGSASPSVSPYGYGGSMARFTVVNKRLYTVGDSELSVFDISQTEDPAYVTRKNIGWNIETIYPFMDKLFIGSQTGMFIYDVKSADNPVQVGQFSHAASCDPVISDGKYAYVTLRTGTACTRNTNELDVLALNNLTNPALLKTYALTNPHGLSKDGSVLFICDGRDGLKIYNADDVSNLKLVKTISGMETYDVIAFNGNAMVVAKDGLYQYSYSDLSNIRLLSKINIQN
jgi:hypothetical protein